MVIENINYPNQITDLVSVLKIDTDLPDWQLSHHEHQSGQLVATISGLITISTENEILVVPPRSAIWIPAKQQHSPLGIGISKCYVVFIKENVFIKPECQVIHVSEFFNSLLIKTETIAPNYAPDSSDARLMHVLIDEIRNAPSHWLHLPLPKEERLKKITDALLRQPDLKINLTQWAEICCMSERSLTRAFKEETNISINNWRRRLHIVLALQWLNEGKSISFITSELGYVSDSSFITMFKKVMKYPPKQFYENKIKN